MKHLIKSLCVMFCLSAVLVSCTEKNNGKFTITVNSDNPTMGKAYGSGEYESGATVRIWGTPEPGYQFTKWNDGNTENPRNITVNADMTYTAYFSTVGGGGDDPGTGGGGETPGDFTASLTVDGTSLNCIALISYGMDQETGSLICLELITGEGAESDPLFYLYILPRTGTQGIADRASCSYMENANDLVMAANGGEYPHYQTINGCNYSINVTAFDMTAQTVTLTSSGELFDIKRAENGEGAHKINYSVSIDGNWQYPSSGESK